MDTQSGAGGATYYEVKVMRITLPGQVLAAAARRREESQRRKMAELVVDALGLGTGKQEEGVAAEVFAEFGVDLVGLIRSVPQRTPDRARAQRALAAAELSAAAPSTGAIVAALSRAGGLLVSMAEEVYQLLADQDATTTGTTERFVIMPEEIDTSSLTLSPAFFEDVTRLITESISMSVPELDYEAVERFLLLDNGTPYGQWPLNASGPGFALPMAVLGVAGALAHLDNLAVTDPSWEETPPLARRAMAAAEALVETAELLVRGFADHMTLVAAATPTGTERSAYVARQVGAFKPDGWFDASQAADEVRRFLATGFLGATVWVLDDAGRGQAHEVAMSVGQAGAIRRRVEPTSTDRPASPVAGLAAWCVMFREGLIPNGRGDELHSRLRDPETWAQWLGSLTDACDQAQGWLTRMLEGVQREVSGERVREQVAKLLSLPLWRHRDLLYEVWLLVATMRACQEAGADLELSGLDPETRAWVLPTGRAHKPVAYILFRPGGQRLEVWREPLRATAEGAVLTPDVTVSTPGPTPQDLVIVEAKDRIKMAEAAAVAVGRRYADGLSPRLTWVANHCEFRLGRETSETNAHSPESRNHGDPWSPIHLAGRLRPGFVPRVFAETIVVAIRPSYRQAIASATTRSTSH